jgi:hypothetical protein
MSWRKYFKTAANSGAMSPISGASVGAQSNFKFDNYSSMLPDVYAGHTNRIERYAQYIAMDADSEVNSALDIISEFCTQANHENGTAFDLHFYEKPTETEISILKKQLQAWNALNQFEKRMFKMFRNVLMYGDQIFLRDPETFKLFWVEMTNVTKVIVNESQGKEPEQYVLRNVNPNFQNLTVTQVTADNFYHTMPNTGGYGAANYNLLNNPASATSRFSKDLKELTFEAQHIVHLSLSEGLDSNWPFGNSILENVFKVFKQKELLEDAIIIYRVQRAPERRVFKIDVGNMPSHMAMAFVDRVKNEMHQRRIPTQSGGQNFLDSTYNPIGINEDFYFPVTAEGRGSSVETLPGGCLAMDTEVLLLDGRTLSISELTTEYKQGKENWTYSCDPKTGKIVPGLISWAGVTHESAQVIKLTLDNSKTIVCTPDHKFPVPQQGLVEAKDLSAGQQLFSVDEQVVNVQRIEILSDPIQVGTLTIDVDEKYHDYHNFALAVGVFTQNSNLGEIDDLKFFTNKLFRGLRIPSSYLPTGAEDSAAIHNDGKVATALIQEHRFNQYCMRLQSLICAPLDREFKAFLKWRGFNIDNSMFDLRMNEPQNFAQYRQTEVDNARIQAFSQMESLPYMSKRFMLKRFLGLTEEEMLENNQLWREENAKPADVIEPDTSLRNVGISAGGLESDLGGLEAPPDMSMEPEQGGAEGAAAPASVSSEAGAAPAAGTPPAA